MLSFGQHQVGATFCGGAALQCGHSTRDCVLPEKYMGAITCSCQLKLNSKRTLTRLKDFLLFKTKSSCHFVCSEIELNGQLLDDYAEEYSI